MSDRGGGDNPPKTVSCALGTEFDLEPGATEDVCVDLEGEWREDSAVTRHPDLDTPGLEFLSGSVGEGGDHANITFKNSTEEKITIGKDRLAITIKEPGMDAQSAETEQTVDKEAEEKMDTEEPGDKPGKNTEAANDDCATDKVIETTAEDKDKDDTIGDAMDTDGDCSDPPQTEKSENKPQSAEKEKANDDAFDSLFQDTTKATDTTDDASETAEVEKKLDEVNKSEENKKSSPIIKMNFVDESASTELEKNGDKKETGEENNEDSDKMDIMEKSAEEKEEESLKKKEESSEEKKDSKESDKPTLKLASFSTMSTSTENGHSEENEDGCYSCSKLIPSLYEAIVWETMQFCDEVEIFFILNMN